MTTPDPNPTVPTLRLVAVESPYAPPAGARNVLAAQYLDRNLRYLRACMRDCLLRGEAPIASHALYTQPGVLDDTIPGDRELGMRAGWAWYPVVARVVVYLNLGISSGMQRGMVEARRLGRPLVYRTLVGWDDIKIEDAYIDCGFIADADAKLEGKP